MAKKKTDTLVVNQATGKNWALYNGDCCEVIRGIPDESVGLSIHSPPFINLYIYSDSIRDMGNCATEEEFFQHYEFLVEEMLRVTKPGRLAVVHCKDLPLYRGRDGACGLSDFPGDIIRLFTKCGWVYHSRVTIWKCPVVERERTNNNGLLHATVMRDSSQCRQGMADYLVVFRKNPLNDNLSSEPIVRPKGFEEWPGGQEYDPRDGNGYHPSKHARKPGTAPRMIEVDGEKLDLTPSVNIWQRLADPVWFHVDQMDVLNYKLGKDGNDERHICLAEGSLVLTRDRGYVPIESVTTDDYALTHKGNWKRVLATIATGEKECVELKAQGVANLHLTPCHKVWARKPSSPHMRKQLAKIEPDWIPAGDSVGSYVNQKLPPVAESPLNARQWWIVGRWIADGHKDANNSFIVSVGKDKMEEFLSKTGEYGNGFKVQNDATQVRLKCLEPELIDVLNQCGFGAENKQIPPCAVSLNEEMSKALLEGYLSGDGYYLESRNRWMCTSVSRKLLLGISMLAMRCYGSSASVYAGRPERVGTILGRTVNMRQDWQCSFDVPKESDKIQPRLYDDGMWKLVRSAESVGIKPTYCLKVEDDESFHAEGCVVKNCPLQLGIIKESVYLWSNPGDVVLDPFNGIGSTGYQSVLMGRKYIGIELKERYYEVSIDNLKDAEKQANQKDLFSEVE